MVAFAFFLGEREIAEMKKQLHSANKLSEIVKKLEASEVKVEVTTTPGKGNGFVGGVRNRPQNKIAAPKEVLRRCENELDSSSLLKSGRLV
jgi:hypothetical protein